jgi:hypothetical protein
MLPRTEAHSMLQISGSKVLESTLIECFCLGMGPFSSSFLQHQSANITASIHHWAYETAFIDECGYNGARPYWDCTLDTLENGRHFIESIIFDPVVGFGRNGRDGYVPDSPGQMPINSSRPAGTCTKDGPFANVEAVFGWSYKY